MTVYQNEVVWNTFLDLEDDVKPWLRNTNDALDANTQLITDMACAWVQDYCGRPFAPTTFSWRFDGWSGLNGAYLMLPWYPVLEITSVTEWWGTSGPHDLTESTPEAQTNGWQCVYHTGKLIRAFEGLIQKPWFPGSLNIEVDWVAGYNPIPSPVKVATLELISYWVRNTQQTPTGARAGAGSPGDYGNPGAGGSLLWAGIPDRCRALLARYMRQGMG